MFSHTRWCILYTHNIHSFTLDIHFKRNLSQKKKKKKNYRPLTIEVVTLQMENLIWPCWVSSIFEAICLSMKAGCFGVGKSKISLLSIEIIVDTFGLSLANSCTHSNPICIHFEMSIWKHGSHIARSTKAIMLSSFHNFHAWKITSVKNKNWNCSIFLKVDHVKNE